MTTRARALTTAITGLVTIATGIAILWAAGIEFPVYPPPGIVIFLAGATALAVVRRWRWAPVLGVVLSLFFLGGFVLSGAGIDNLAGDEGTVPTIGQAISVLGALITLVASALALRAGSDRAEVR